MRFRPRDTHHPWLWRTLYAVLGVCLCAALVLFWLLTTRSGLRYTERGIERALSDNIPGLVEIGQLEEFGYSRVAARDVRFFHMDGRCLIYAKHAVITPDWSGVFLHGMLAWKEVAIDGGSVELSLDPDGRLSLEAMMNAPRRPGEPNDPYGGLHYSLRDMHVQNLEVRIHLSKPIDIDYRVHNASGFVGVSRIDTPGVQVRLDHINGPIEPEVAGAKVAIADLTGWVHGKALEVVRMHARLRVGSGELAAQIGYFDRKSDKLKIRVDKSHGVEANAMTWFVRAVGTLSKEVKVEEG